MAAVLKSLEEKAAQGDGQACVNLYEEYEQGLHVHSDPILASAWLEKALDCNSADAQLIMAMKEFSQGSPEKGVDYLNLAIENGSAEAMYVMGQVLLDNVEGLCCEAQPEQGLEWVLKAAKAGSVNAQILLGRCYHTGRWVEKNDMFAKHWLEKAEEEGSDLASRLLDEILLVKELLN